MASEQFTEYNLPANAYATFDATSIRDLLISKLIKDDVYTDQIFEGSNISSLIDVLSYTYHLLLFYLNNTATESMFSETEIYENINRIVKLLNYNPSGARTSSVSFDVTLPDNTLTDVSYTIPRYTFLSVGTVKYSFVRDIEFSPKNLDAISEENLLYQGTFKEKEFIASGDDFETITLIQPEGSNFIDFNNIDVYISRPSTTGYIEFSPSPSLFLQSPSDLAFEKRVNESGDIQLKFGNDITGKKLQAGDTIHVIYLNSNGELGTIGPRALASAPITKYLTPLVQDILANTGKVYISTENLTKLQITNGASSIAPAPKEDVEDIKLNAVQAFKSQSRLTTAEDYRVFIETKFGEILSDVVVMNNQDFIKEYIEYIDKTVISDTPGFESRLLYNHSEFSTSTTFNNIYVFVKPKRETMTSNNVSVSFATSSQKNAIKASVNMYKSLTTDITLIDPVYIALDFGLQVPGETLSTQLIGKTSLEITKDPQSLKSTAGIKAAVHKVLTDTFNILTTDLGTDIQLASIIQSIINIEGVLTSRMIRTDIDYAFNGLSFLAWNPVYPDNDISIIQQDTVFDRFKAPYIFDSELLLDNIIIV